MDKKQFLNVVHHFSDSSVDEAQKILSLKADFPYSQLLHALSARMSRDHGFSTQQQELQMAAVYASDRAVLKDIMSKTATEIKIVAAAPSVASPSVSNTPQVAAETDEVYDDVADEIIHDLDRLHELRHNFEMMFADGAVVKPAEVAGPKVVKPVIADEKEAQAPKESTKSRKARIVEMARALAAKDATVSQPAIDVTTPKPSRKRKEHNDALIEEIEHTKEEIEPSGEKLKEQIEIIDQFIKTQPTIVNTKDKLENAPVGDLSSIKSGEFSDNIVSETLVEILMQQGKKDKAIEVLKKLIWKFPQKKAYFAAQIEELKK